MSPKNPLNPLTGDVPLPDEPREIEAALRAGRVTWRLFPYYRWRYGDRGAAFTRSDSAWLVTLCRQPQRQVEEQVEWLSCILSNRGMPSWLLEIHLEVLYRELARTLPEKDAAYQRLLTASFVLGDARRQRISEEHFERLSSTFAAEVGSPANRWMLGTGRLLIAAVADEKGGMRHAVGRLESWLTDPVRFDEARRYYFAAGLREVLETITPRRWAETVRATLDSARHV